MSRQRQKIAIIGGGVGAVTAAYAITQLPDWQDRYQITFYQLGWRLGGKGASGRNATMGERIEEHGLHIWAGFYDNAFRLMRDCYETMVREGLRAPDAPLATLEEAFHGLNHFLLAEEVPQPDGTSALHPWRIDFEPNDQPPGSGDVVPSAFSLFKMALEKLRQLIDGAGTDSLPGDTLPKRFQPAFTARSLPLQAPTPLHQLDAFARTLDDDARNLGRQERAELAGLITHVQDWHDGVMRGLPDNDESRRLQYLVSLSLAFFRGAMAEGCFLKGFDAIDDWEISDWLLHYGASREAVYSAVFRGCYDYVFGYPGGVTDDRSVGAGTAIRGLLRLAFCYKGSLFFKMQAGMGDTIFAPYYQVLRQRGVEFRFFNAATRLVLDDDKAGIAAIEMVEQARTKGEYQPLRDVAGLPCWPSEPLWDQISDYTDPDFECEKTPPRGRPYRLERGTDFDQVILGASLGSMPYLAGDLAQASPRWKAMMAKVQTVATHAAQFWTDKTPDQLDWNALVSQHNSGSQTDLQTVITSFAEPLDTWADMSDLLVRETWPDPKPAAIAYFCSPAHDAGVDQGSMQQRTRDWADTQLVRMWPGALKDGRFDAGILHTLDGKGDDDARFAAQYYRQNFYGSERYVLSVPGSVQYRLPPDASGFDNLYLAGDWTRCGINAGCVEAATISGLGAARGLTGADIKIVGEGDLTPDDGPGDQARLASPYAQTAPWPLTPVYGAGKIDGWFSFHAIDAKMLEATLPPGMHLLPQGLTPAGTHPVAMLANQQIGVRMSVLPQFLGYRNYFEAIVAINWVGIDGQPGIFSYLPNLYLNSRAPQLAGVLFYAFNKRMGQLSMDGDGYTVASPSGQPIWSGRFQQPGFSRPLMESPECGAVEALCQQVVVSRDPLGHWRYASFDFNLTSARIAPVRAEIQVSNANLANLPKGTMTSRPLTMDPGTAEIATRQYGLPGAFRIWTSWTLSNPFDSHRLAALEAERSRLP